MACLAQSLHCPTQGPHQTPAARSPPTHFRLARSAGAHSTPPVQPHQSQCQILNCSQPQPLWVSRPAMGRLRMTQVWRIQRPAPQKKYWAAQDPSLLRLPAQVPTHYCRPPARPRRQGTQPRVLLQLPHQLQPTQWLASCQKIQQAHTLPMSLLKFPAGVPILRHPLRQHWTPIPLSVQAAVVSPPPHPQPSTAHQRMRARNGRSISPSVQLGQYSP